MPLCLPLFWLISHDAQDWPNLLWYSHIWKLACKHQLFLVHLNYHNCYSHVHRPQALSCYPVHYNMWWHYVCFANLLPDINELFMLQSHHSVRIKHSPLLMITVYIACERCDHNLFIRLWYSLVNTNIYFDSEYIVGIWLRSLRKCCLCSMSSTPLLDIQVA